MAVTLRKKILITGASGILGSNLAFFFKDYFDVTGIYHLHSVSMEGVRMVQADLSSAAITRNIVKNYKPDIVIHCAAQANVDACEENPESARRQNVEMTRNIVKALAGRKTRLVFISTDLVYGLSGRPHREDEPLLPCNEYGRTKVMAEEIVLARQGSLVLRTNFFGWSVGGRKSFGEWVIESLSQNIRIQGFKDVYFSSIYTLDFAEILNLCLRKNICGVFNLGASTSLSKYEFLKSIADSLGLMSSLIEKISVEALPLSATRNKNTVMDVHKISAALGIKLPSAQASVEHFVAHYRKGMYRVISGAEVCYPKLDHIPYGRQWIDDEDINAVVQVLKSPNVAQGPKIIEFEYALTQYTGAEYCAALNSGTSALHAACLAIGVKKGDEVITSANTFVASANCAAYCSGTPIFADIDLKTYNISPREVERKITARTRAVIPVHFAGQSCDMQALYTIVRKKEKQFGRKIYIIEDASHALGSYYKKMPVGNCCFSDIAVLSFHPVKHITTGEGGAVLTNNKELYRKACYFRSHGITGFSEELVDQREGFEEAGAKGLMKKPWYYEQLHLGYNYRITDIQCALGISQLRKLSMFSQHRRKIWAFYNHSFAKFSLLTTPYESIDAQSNFHLYVVLINFAALRKTRTEVMLALKDFGIGTQVHYIPVYKHPFYRKRFNAAGVDCPNAEKYYQRCLSLPIFPAMKDRDVRKVVESVYKVLQ